MELVDNHLCFNISGLLFMTLKNVKTSVGSSVVLYSIDFYCSDKNISEENHTGLDMTVHK